MDKRQVKALLVAFCSTVAALMILVALFWWVARPLLAGLTAPGGGGNRTVVSFREQFHLDPDVPLLFFGPRHVIEHPPPIVEGGPDSPSIFLPAGFLRENIDPFLFWDDASGELFISTDRALLEIRPGERSCLMNGWPLALDTPVRLVDGEPFLPADLIHAIYPWLVEYNGEHGIVVVTDATEWHYSAEVTRDGAPVRHWGHGNAPAVANLGVGEFVFMYADEPSMSPDLFVRVRTFDGMLGYMDVSDIRPASDGRPRIDREPLLQAWADNRRAHEQNWPIGVRVSMVWDSISSHQANASAMQREPHPSIGVISPTWFTINESGTGLESRASLEYVQWAHSRDMQVWPKVFDLNTERARAMLTSRSNRRNVINQLVEQVDSLGLDGININFENLLVSADGLYKVQFLRELAIPLRERGVVLSAALKPPYSFNMIYQPRLIGLTVDFVQIMAYNQTDPTGSVPGPNASLPWVQWAVETMLEEVPNYRLMLGLPFFVRMWWANPATGEVAIRTDPETGRESPWIREVGISFEGDVKNHFRQLGGEEEWLDEQGLYYGEIAVVEGGEVAMMRVWFECDRSIRAKMQVFAQHNLVGVAGWSLGLETPVIWEVLGRFFE